MDDYQNIIVPGMASISFDVNRFLGEFNSSQYQDSHTGSTRLSLHTSRPRAPLRVRSEIYCLRALQTQASMYVWKLGTNCKNWLIHCLITQWFASPACTELEAVVMDWAAKMLGLHSVFWNANGIGGGVIQVRSCFSPACLRTQFFFLFALWQTTASDSTLTAIVVARARYLIEHPDTKLESLVIYVTTQTHASGAKAGKILGLRVRAIDVDVAVVTDNTGLTGEALRTAVKEDHAQGLHPFVFGEYLFVCICLTLADCSHHTVATVGTTSSGSIDHVADVGATSMS